jgi:hypothetical protein
MRVHPSSKSGATPALPPTSPSSSAAGLARSASHKILTKGSGMGGLVSSQRKGVTPVLPPPPKAHVYRERPVQPTEFRRFYLRGDLPVSVQHMTKGDMNLITWAVDIDKLDFHHYLPIFMDGIREREEPFRTLAIRGVDDMLEAGGPLGKVLPVVPQLIIPIKTALNTRNREIISVTLRCLQKLVECGDHIGEALVPYYRQVLPVMNIFVGVSHNMGDSIDYSQRKKNDVGELITETLQLFERRGGEDAYINLKYLVPTYESCLA